MNSLSCLSALLLFTSVANAGAFEPRQVPSTAPWILHVDLEAAARSTILRSLHEDGIRIENEFDLDEVGTEFGLAPLEDLRSLTLYGGGERGEGNVCIAVGTTALSAARSRLAERGGRALRVGGVDALQLASGRSARFLALLPESTESQRVAVIASSEALLAKALLVLQGEAPSMASAAADNGRRRDAATAKPAPSIAARPTAGSLVFAASATVARLEDNAEFLRRALGIVGELADLSHEQGGALTLGARAMEFELAEVGGEMQLRLSLDTPAPAKAKELEEILRGAVTRTALPTDSPQVRARMAEILGALKLEVDGGRLVVRYRYSAERFVDDVGFVERTRGIRSGN